MCKELIYIDYSQMRQYIIMEKSSDFSFTDLEQSCLRLAGIYDNIAQISYFFSAVEHLMKAWKESAIPMKRLFLFFITELRLLPDFLFLAPVPFR